MNNLTEKAVDAAYASNQQTRTKIDWQKTYLETLINASEQNEPLTPDQTLIRRFLPFAKNILNCFNELLVLTAETNQWLEAIQKQAKERDNGNV